MNDVIKKCVHVLTLLAFFSLAEAQTSTRIGMFLSQHCYDISLFLKPACSGLNTPPCCTLFALVDVCRSTCNGKANPFATQALARLISDPTVCSQLQMAGHQFCHFRNTPECNALQCLMTLVCFDSRASCFVPRVRPRPPVTPVEPPRNQPPKVEVTPDVQASGRSNRHARERGFELPEMAACESTNLLTFDNTSVRQCPPFSKTTRCEGSTLVYRTVDGACNNLDHPDWGRSFQPPQRYLNADYGDSEGYPRWQAKSGAKLKSPRYISRYVSPFKDRVTKLSAINMAWGQFIDHDFTGFPVIKHNKTDIKCCVDNVKKSLLIENGGPCYPINIDDSEDFFRGQKCMEFARSSPAEDENGVLLTPREQLNALTSYIDGSTVYGSTPEVNDMLKLPSGKLVVSANNMLPRSKKMNCKIVDNTTDFCLLAGDHRVNVFVGLGVFHTIFHRHHNQLVDGLAKINPQWDGEKLYQEARKIVAALHQHINYDEYLPSFLNDATLDKYRLRVGDFKYDPTVRPDMANVFSTAAFRFGHSQVQRFVKAGSDYFPTEDTLMRPHLVLTRFDEVAEGLAFGKSDKVDRFFVESLTDRMFEKKPLDRDGLDLVALNVQRGRDHGLPSYNEFRKFCQLAPVDSFLSEEFESPNELDYVYEHPDDIDVFIGGITERHLPGSQVGPLFSCILAQQFHDIKFGDRFFYETTDRDTGFTFEQLREIKKQTLASVMCANTDIPYLQQRTMLLPDTQNQRNPYVPCRDQPRLNLFKWATRSST